MFQTVLHSNPFKMSALLTCVLAAWRSISTMLPELLAVQSSVEDSQSCSAEADTPLHTRKGTISRKVRF